MLGTYEDCQQTANSQMCAHCQHDSILLVRHVAGRPGPGDRWEVYCPGCQERERFVRPESLTSQWRRDPGSVNIAIANKLERKYGGNPMTDRALTVISKQEMVERIDGARWAHQLTPAQVLTVAEIAVRYGYDPLMNEVTVYEGKIYVTLDGALRDAKRVPNFQGIQTSPLTQEEREARGIKQPIAYKCELYRADWKVPAVGIGVADPNDPFRNNPVERKQPHALAEARAIRRAVRLAREAPAVTVRQDIDPETGEILAAVAPEPAVEAESVRVAPAEVLAEPAANGDRREGQAKEGTLTKCADCEKPILGHQGKTKFWAAEELIDLSTETYDRALCYGCSLKAKAAKTEVKPA